MIYLLLVILVVALAVLWMMNAGLARRHALSPRDVAEIRGYWSKIESLMNDNHEAAWPQAIIAADKLLDMVLTKKNIYGQNLGDKLKNSTHLFHNVQNVWEAHKFRNHIAHEMDAQVSRREAERIIGLFRQALRELKAL